MAYKNPVPHLGGKKFNVNMTFDFKEFVDLDEAKVNIEEYIRRNGLPAGTVCDVTPVKEYLK